MNCEIKKVRGKGGPGGWIRAFFVDGERVDNTRGFFYVGADCIHKELTSGTSARNMAKQLRVPTEAVRWLKRWYAANRGRL